MLCVRKAIPRTRSSCGRRSCLRSYNIVLTHAQRARRPASYIQGNTVDKNILSSNPLFVRNTVDKKQVLWKTMPLRWKEDTEIRPRQQAAGPWCAAGQTWGPSAKRLGRLQRSEALPPSWSRPARPGASQTPVELLRLADALRQEGHPQNSQQLWKTKLPALLQHSSYTRTKSKATSFLHSGKHC